MSILNECVKIVRQIQKSENINASDLCQLLLVECLGRVNIPNMFDDILLHYSEEDTSYKSFLCECIPDAEKLVYKLETNGSKELNTYFPAMCTLFVWNFIKKHLGNENEKLKAILETSNADDVPFDVGSGVIPYPKVIDNNVWSELDAYLGNSNDMMTCLKSALWVYETIKSNVKPDNKEIELPDNVDPEIINGAVGEIMRVLKILYEPCFTEKPKGVLTSEGIMKLEKDGSPYVIRKGASYMTKIYRSMRSFYDNFLPEFTDRELIGVDYIDEKCNLLKSYSPMFHLKCINGYLNGKHYKNWLELSVPLKKYITGIITNILTQIDETMIFEASRNLKQLFTTCIIIQDFDIQKDLKMVFKVGTSEKCYAKHLSDSAYDLLGSNAGELASNDINSLGIESFLYITDKRAYDAEILFAYKAYEKLCESGVSPSVNSIILGRKVNGENVISNFDDAGQIVTGIIAGSRSGKGVMTLNILASIIASGCPVCYLDYKPDMAATLWDLERELTSKGYPCRIFSIDSKMGTKAGNKKKPAPSLPVRNYVRGMNKPDYCKIPTDKFNALPYLKSLQLMCIAAELRTAGALSTDSRLFFILDELQQFSLVTLRDLLNAAENTQKPKKDSAPEIASARDYADKIIEAYGAGLSNEIASVINTTGGVGRVSMIYLGQDAWPSKWGQKGELGHSLFSCTKFKIMGRNAGSGSQYSLNSEDNDVKQFIQNEDTFGYWTSFLGAEPPKTGNKAMKSYLVLNDNDFDLDAYNAGQLDKGSATGALLNNIKDASVRDLVATTEFVNPETNQLRDSVGFAGLMKYISRMAYGDMSEDEANKDLANKLSAGYNLMEDVCCRLGLMTSVGGQYSTIEEYLCDASVEGILSLAELRERLVTNGGNKSDFIPTKPVEDKKGFSFNPFNVSDSFETSGESAPQNNSFDVPNDENSYEYDDWSKNTTKTSNPNINFDSVHNGKSDSPNQRTAYNNVYDAPADIEVNPFAIWKSRESVLSGLNNINITSKQLLNTIAKAFGGLDRINHFAIVSDGVLVINGVQFKPKFPDDMIQSMPVDVRNNVLEGKLADIFYLPHIYKFPNLATIDIENQEVASYRLRPELGIKDSRSFNKFGGFKLNKLPMLSSFMVLGKEILPPKMELSDEIPVNKSVDSTLDFSLRDKLANTYNVSPLSYAAKIWNKPIFKITRRALGYTIGTKLVVSACLAAGPMGLLFGAFFAHSIYKYNKENRNANSKSNVKSSGGNKKL